MRQASAWRCKSASGIRRGPVRSACQSCEPPRSHRCFFARARSELDREALRSNSGSKQAGQQNRGRGSPSSPYASRPSTATGREATAGFQR